MNRFVRRDSIIYFLIFTAIYLITVISGAIYRESSAYAALLGFASIGMMLWVTWSFRNNTSLFICFFMVFYSVYSIVVAVYLFPEMSPAFMFSQFGDKSASIAGTGMQCMFLFCLTVFFLVMNGRAVGAISFELKPADKRSQIRYDPFIVFACVVMILYVTSTNLTFGGASSRLRGTALYEYNAVFFIVGMMYSGNSKGMRAFWLVMVTIHGAITLFGGNRAEAIPLFFSYIFFYHNSIKPKYSLAGILGGVVLMISLGVFRQMTFRGGFNIQSLFKRLSEGKLAFDTAYFAYSPSLQSIAIANTVSLAEKFRVLLGNLEYVILGGRSSGAAYILENYTRQFYLNVGGYVSPTYFYMWAGLFGAVLFGLLIYFYIRLLSRFENRQCKRKNEFLCMAVSAYFVATVGRWLMYGPFPLIRSELIMLVVTLAAGAFDRVYQQLSRRKQARA